jgi:hypothetical protein
MSLLSNTRAYAAACTSAIVHLPPRKARNDVLLIHYHQCPSYA